MAPKKVLHVPAVDCKGIAINLHRHSDGEHTQAGVFNTLVTDTYGLTPQGIQKAMNATKISPNDHVYYASSPMRRCQETAMILAGGTATKCHVPIDADSAFSEPRFLNQEGRPAVLEMVLQYDETCSTNFFCDYIPEIGDVEKFSSLVKRYVNGLKELIIRAKKAGKTEIDLTAHYHTYRILALVLSGRFPFESMSVPTMAHCRFPGTTKTIEYWILEPVVDMPRFSLTVEGSAEEAIQTIVLGSGKKIDVNVIIERDPVLALKHQ